MATGKGRVGFPLQTSLYVVIITFVLMLPRNQDGRIAFIGERRM